MDSIRIKGFKQEGVNCLMKDFLKYLTRMKINEEAQKKQSNQPRNKTVFN